MIGAMHRRLIELVGDNKRVLALGLASASLTQLLAERGCRVVCVEFDAGAGAGAGAGAWAARVIVADLDAPGFAEQLGEDDFDVVVASDLLEHLKHPEDV